MNLGRRPAPVKKRLRYHDEESVRDDIKKKEKKTFRVLPHAVVIFDDNSRTVIRQWIVRRRGRDPAKIEQLRLIEEAEMRVVRDLLGKLKAKQEAGAPLLDRTMVVFGSNLGNANSHDTRNLPILLAGGSFKHGRHVAFDPKNNTRLCNLFVTMLQRLGVETDTFGSSTGTLTGMNA